MGELLFFMGTKVERENGFIALKLMPAGLAGRL
jgi:hypothetical protein